MLLSLFRVLFTFLINLLVIIHCNYFRPEEENAAAALGLKFVPIRSSADLQALCINVELGHL
jgi:hypothetical protein